MKRKGGASFQSGFQSAGPRRRVGAPFRAPRRVGGGRRLRGREFVNKTTMGFLGIEKKFYDTALVSATLVRPGIFLQKASVFFLGSSK